MVSLRPGSAKVAATPRRLPLFRLIATDEIAGGRLVTVTFVLACPANPAASRTSRSSLSVPSSSAVNVGEAFVGSLSCAAASHR